MIEFLTESSLDFVNCIECKREVRPIFGPLANFCSLQSLKNITNGRQQNMDYSKKTCHLIAIEQKTLIWILVSKTTEDVHS